MALGITYEHPLAFWAGVTSVTVGTLMQLPMYFGAKDMGYRLRGMPFDTTMVGGMALMLAGLGLTVYGLLPRRSDEEQGGPGSQIRIEALDQAPITRAHIGLILVMAAAITIDVMKPTTLAFVAPGAAAEYGLRSPLNPGSNGLPIALYPLAGISGTVLGAFLWGWLADRMGRRASILLAAVMFIGTSTCGAMPAYTVNLGMCFAMGLGVGGMLPIIFSLVSETMPARHRGWIVVLIGGDVAGAYVIMSWLASTIGAPDRYGWRILWLIGIPVSLLLVLLNRWIPESPRFLLQRGRGAEAEAVMRRYGAVVVETQEAAPVVGSRVNGGYAQLFRRPFTGLTVVLVMLALGIGTIQYGFQQWIPSNLQKLGYDEVDASRILRDSALIGFPLNLPVALLYGLWSSKKTIVLLGSMTACALLGFAAAGDRVAQNGALLQALLVVPIWGISSLTAVTAAYAAEIYPTRIRARGSGLAAAGTKFGGVLILAAVTIAVAPPSIPVTALLGAVPIIGAVALTFRYGVETRKKGLEQISADRGGEGHSSPHPPGDFRRSRAVAGGSSAMNEQRTKGRRVFVVLGLAALLASAVVSSNVYAIRERLLGSALPEPQRPALSRVAGVDGSAGEGITPDPTTLRSAPWWQEVTSFEGAGVSAPSAVGIDRRAIQWRVRSSCQEGRLVVRATGQPEPLIDTACPAEAIGHSSRSGPASLQVTTDGPWRLDVAQQIDLPLVEPTTPAQAAPGTATVAAGSFYKVDRTGAGTVKILSQADGRFSTRLEDFFVSANTHLQLRLSAAEAPRSSEEYRNARSQLLAVMDVTAGSLTYTAPVGVDPGGFRSVVIWCPLTDSAYAAARLEPTR